ncbi:hypothetical protein J2R76_000132 [Bradyrhizobium sp. USDA 4532]|nr:hypothetical protein [Bradyrhizobium sp. USDA 4545]MCP1916541.1 hypothetical protein [Bradyrhizobium sp. USDA 4532]
MVHGIKTGGRKKGAPILEAARKAGGKGGMVAYLEAKAKANRARFSACLARCCRWWPARMPR